MKVQLKILDNEYYNFTERTDIDDSLVSELPNYTTDGSAAMDLVCTKDIEIAPGEVQMIPTGLAIWVGSSKQEPTNKWNWVNSSDLSVAAMIMPRSGLGQQGLILSNTIGLIDEDYQGELMVSAWNRTAFDGSYSANMINLKAGSRFAQLLFIPIIKVEWDFVNEFSDVTERGEGGFNSTGV